MSKPRLVSLFAGIGGFDLGFERAGFEIAAHVEIDPHCRRVLRAKWPNTICLEDVREAGARNLPACDVVTFGFPCQDLSVAGKRRGLEGERSGLFYEALRIIDELKPTWAIWENVPGLLSSDGGRDFARVLFSMVEHGYSGCYRVLDSQWLGVAQRRRRVFGVFTRGHSGALRAAEILSISESLRGHPAPSRGQRPRIAAYTASSFGAYSEGVGTVRTSGGDVGPGSENLIVFQGQASATQGISANTKTSPTLDRSKTPCIAISDVVHSKDENGKGWNDTDVAYTLDTRATQEILAPIILASGQSNAEMTSNIAPTLNCGHDQPIYFERRFVRNKSGMPRSDGTANTLCAGHGGTGDAAPHVAGEGYGVRRLTPLECERLQGFPDNWTDVLSDSQRYKAMGNAVTVNVAEWIARRLMKQMKRENHGTMEKDK